MRIAEDPKPISGERRERMEHDRRKPSCWHWLTTSLTAFVVNLWV